MSDRMGTRSDWDAKGCARTSTVDGVPEEEACGFSVVASVTQDSQKSCRRATDNAAVPGVSQLPESSIISPKGGVSVSAAC